MGTPIAGSILLALNYRAMGSPAAAWKAALVGVVGLAALVFLAAVLPETVPSAILAVGQTFGMWYVAMALQGKAIALRRQQGGRQGSWFVAFGTGLVCLVVAIGTLALYSARPA